MSAEFRRAGALTYGSRICPAGLKAIIFDVDGTLYTQARLRRAMAIRVVRHAIAHPLSGGRVIQVLRAFRSAQEYLRSAGCSDSICGKQFQLTCEWTGLGDDQVRGIVELWMEKEPLPLLKGCLRPGLLAVLESAKAAGIGLGVFSDYAADKKLEAMGIRHYFNTICAAQDEEIGRFKPHPKGLEVTLNRLNVSPEHALYIGDRPDVDVEAAQRAGLRAVIIGSGAAPAGASWVGIRTFLDLGEML
jgi:FMN phosphatase YigB (HAD superfamily)